MLARSATERSRADAAGYRSTFQSAGTRRDRLARQLSSTFPGSRAEEHELTGLDDIEQDLRSAIARGAAARPQRRRRLARAHKRAENLVRELAGSPTRTHDLDLDLPRVYREQRTVKPPAGYAVRSVPKGGKVESRFGSLTLTTEQRGGAAISDVAFVLAVKRVAKGDYAEFRRFVEQAESLLRPRTAFARPTAPTSKETR